MKKIVFNKRPTSSDPVGHPTNAAKVGPGLNDDKSPEKISLPFSNGPKGDSEKEKEKEKENALSAEPDHSDDGYKELIEKYQAGSLLKVTLYNLLRELWGNDVLKGTRSCHENMKSRCNSGYEVLDPAFQKFDNFLLHMGPRPGQQFSIDRTDNTKGYSPGNCRWADKATQTRNRSNTVILTADGKTLPLGVWACHRPAYWSHSVIGV